MNWNNGIEGWCFDPFYIENAFISLNSETVFGTMTITQHSHSIWYNGDGPVS